MHGRRLLLQPSLAAASGAAVPQQLQDDPWAAAAAQQARQPWGPCKQALLRQLFMECMHSLLRDYDNFSTSGCCSASGSKRGSELGAPLALAGQLQARVSAGGSGLAAAAPRASLGRGSSSRLHTTPVNLPALLEHHKRLSGCVSVHVQRCQVLCTLLCMP